jgi:hypothetical protein
MLALRLVAPAAALLALAACNPSTFRGWPDPPHKFADCTGAPAGLAACHEQARAMCGGEYQLAEQRSDPDINRHQIIVRCGPPLAIAPEPAAPRPVVRRAAPQPVPK